MRRARKSVRLTFSITPGVKAGLEALVRTGLFGKHPGEAAMRILSEKLQDGTLFRETASSRQKPTVLLSYSHSDKPMVRALARFLWDSGIVPWMDEGELSYGDSLIERLRGAIDTVDLVLALLSESSVKSHWVKRELDIAMNREIEDRRITVIPILRDKTELPGFLKGKVYVDYTTPYRRRVNRHKLVNSIFEHVGRIRPSSTRKSIFQRDIEHAMRSAEELGE